jgi:hypothetical protein
MQYLSPFEWHSFEFSSACLVFEVESYAVESLLLPIITPLHMIAQNIHTWPNGANNFKLKYYEDDIYDWRHRLHWALRA